ncbi:MAG: glutamine synthetase III [Oscillospiraceae bacterium]|nr:glutamine synthetase III [Oscillospiraceae bacterium]
MTNLPELFGCMAFNESVMRERLPKGAYSTLKNAIEKGGRMDLTTANIVANAMKDWATEKGATHYTHWFQPLTGITAEKHDSFIAPCGDGGVIMEFSGKELIKGEPDASSFPSGGLRATFEARGYTAWDPTSYAFIKDGVLCIPTAFCSYGGEALDTKTPLLRSMEALNLQAKRILKLFGTECERVSATAGLEQEYFIVDRNTYNQRKDLIYTGRTLLGARPPKGQEMDDHYFGSIKIRVSSFMKELNEELWKLGVLAKTEHNEAAPAQHELAPIFSTANIAIDHNQLTMEIMRKVAKRHDLTCLLHEKPFEGVNGSGKHNNWALSTDDGVNLLEPGDTPEENAQFLLIICAVLKAVDDYQDLLRISVASCGNDHRLGGDEAPPAIVSVYLGDELQAILDSIKSGTVYDRAEKKSLTVGVDVLPPFPRDTTDRNRTSPFAFTGNKFEFRMLGSSMSASASTTFINTIVAETFRQFADRLEKAEDFTSELNTLIRETITEHERIIFNGNGYDESWTKEAAKRGLSNYPSTADCLPHLMDEKNVRLFERHGVYSETELRARRDILLESYCKQINIEAQVMLEMIHRDIVPAVISFEKTLADTINAKAQIKIESKAETKLLGSVSGLLEQLYDNCQALEEAAAGVKLKNCDLQSMAVYCHESVIPAMNALRVVADKLECLVSKDLWPYPSYGRLLYRV